MCVCIYIYIHINARYGTERRYEGRWNIGRDRREGDEDAREIEREDKNPFFFLVFVLMSSPSPPHRKSLRLEVSPDRARPVAEHIVGRIYSGIQGVLLTLRHTRGRGLGLFVVNGVGAFKKVVEYSGTNVTSKKEMKRLEEKYLLNDHGYLMAREGGGGVDATYVGGVGRYANHGCIGTCSLHNSEGKLVLWSGRDGLAPGEEVTYNYDCGEGVARLCKCGEGCSKAY